MPDYGARVADKAIQETERKLRSTYSTAQRELQKKLKTFNDKYKVKDAMKRKQLAEGKISKQDYADWKAGQVFQRKQWEAKVKEVVSVMTNSNEQAAKIINEGRLDVFSENYNFLAFLGEKQIGISFDVYNTQAVARLIQDDPQILPEWKIDEEKDYEWNYKKVNNIVQQGIIQGEGIPEMTKRLCEDLTTQNENKMRMFARTAMTGAQNAGRQQQMEDAAEMGIQVEKQWIATLDSRTRDWHRDRDGETVPYNEEFSGGLEYPGDPAGDPADVYNCRCTMITVYPEHAAYHEGGPRRASAEWTDEDGTKHQQSYLTVNPNVYDGWSEKAYRRWLEKKFEQNKIVEPKKSEYQTHLDEYDKKLYELREKRQAMFDADSYDKAETDALLQQILDVEQERVDYITAYHLSNGDMDIYSKLMSDDPQKIAQGCHDILEKKGLQKSVWNGKVLVEENPSYAGAAGWDGTLKIAKDYCKDAHTFIHEHLHFRSVNVLPDGATVYSKYYIARNLEEGAVELFTQRIMEDTGLKTYGTYKELVDSLKTIEGIAFKGMSNYEFAEELFKTPVLERISFIEEKVNAYKKANPDNADEIENLDSALVVLKKR